MAFLAPAERPKEIGKRRGPRSKRRKLRSALPQMRLSVGKLAAIAFSLC
jgi:hypothetical protein